MAGEPIPISRADYAAKFGGAQTQPLEFGGPYTDIPVKPTPIPISRAEYAAKFQQPETPSLFSDPVGALSSADWWLTRPDGKRISAGQALTEVPLSLLNTMTFGFGDEITAGGSALIDAALGRGSIGDSYDSRLQQVREIRGDTPVAMDVAMGLASLNKLPVPTSIKSSDGILKTGAKLAGEGALISGAYGFGSGEGGALNRLENAGESAAVGGVLAPAIGVPLVAASKAAGAFAKAAPGEAQAYKAQALGIKPSDFTKSARRTGVDRDAATSLKKAVRALEKEGIFEGSLDAVDLYNRSIGKAREIGGNLTTVLKEADEIRFATSPNSSLKFSFNEAENFIKNARVDEIPELTKRLDQYKNALVETGDNSLTFLQRQKEAIYDTAYPQGARVVEDLDKAIARDLKKTIEQVTDSVLPREKAGIVRQLNRRLGAFEETRPIFQRELGKTEGATLGERLKAFVRTSGGYGTFGLGGAYMGGAPGAIVGLGAAKALNYLSSPKGSLGTARIIEKGGNFAKKIPDVSDIVSRALGQASAGLKGLISEEGDPNRQAPNRVQTPLANSKTEARKSPSYKQLLQRPSQQPPLQKAFSNSPSPYEKKVGSSDERSKSKLAQQSASSKVLSDIDRYPLKDQQPQKLVSQRMPESLLSDSPQMHKKEGKIQEVSPRLYRPHTSKSQRETSFKPTPTPIPTQAQKQPIGNTREDVRAHIKNFHPLLQAVIAQESNYNPKAKSSAGALGLMQVMPENLKKLKVKNPYDTEENIRAGVKLLNEEITRFKDIRLALAAYNAGSPAVTKAIRKAGSKSWFDVARFLPAETRAYVPSVMRQYREFSKQKDTVKA